MAVARSSDPRYGAVRGLTRVVGASVVVGKGLEGESSSKVKETKNKKVLGKLECIEHFHIVDHYNVSPNIYPYVYNTNPHVSIFIIYQASYIVSNSFIPPAQSCGLIQI